MTNSDVNSGNLFKNHEELGKVYIAFTWSTLEKGSTGLNTPREDKQYDFPAIFSA